MLFLRAKGCLSSRLKSLATLQRFNHMLGESGLEAKVYSNTGSDFVAQQSHAVDSLNWRKMDAKYLGIRGSMIPSATWIVLKILHNEGHKAYLVGGCVRDLILKKVPKDFDVITTARLKQIKKLFHRCLIVGRRFPICLVHMKSSTVEVSSFDTVAEHPKKEGNCLDDEDFIVKPSGCDEEDFRRWRNSMHRDFTINSLFFDPFLYRIYDYANGMADLRALKLRTLIPAQLSFQEDCARILRGLRIAGRLGLSISKDTETAICKLSSSVTNLSQARIMMELNYMLAYGAAESTLCLLRRFNLLEIFLPFHAAYLDEQAGANSDQSSTMLMKLISNLDMMVSSDHPCDCSLWVGLLAFHQSLVINPQDALVVWAFASVLYHGTWKDGVKFARENATVLNRFATEISGFTKCSDKELAEKVAQLAALVLNSLGAFVDTNCLYESMSRYPMFRCSGLVFLSKKTGDNVAKLFEVLDDDVECYDNRRENLMTDSFLLGKGNLDETRFVLGKVILQTLSGGPVGGGELVQEKSIKKNNDSIHPELSREKFVGQRRRKGGWTAFDPELEKAKKQKFTECLSKQEITVEEEVVLKDASHKKAKKLEKAVEGQMSRLHEVDPRRILMNTLEKKDVCTPKWMGDEKCTNVENDKKLDRVTILNKMVGITEKQQETVQASCDKEIRMKVASMSEMESLHSHKIADESCTTVDDGKHKGRAKKLMKVEKLKHHLLHDKETKMQLDVTDECNLSIEKTIKPNERRDQCQSLEEGAEGKTEKTEQVLHEERTGRRPLYSLFM